MHTITFISPLLSFIYLFLVQLGINPAGDNPTELEPWDALIERMTYLFSNEVGVCLNSLLPAIP